MCNLWSNIGQVKYLILKARHIIWRKYFFGPKIINYINCMFSLAWMGRKRALEISLICLLKKGIGLTQHSSVLVSGKRVGNNFKFLFFFLFSPFPLNSFIFNSFLYFLENCMLIFVFIYFSVLIIYSYVKIIIF